MGSLLNPVRRTGVRFRRPIVLVGLVAIIAALLLLLGLKQLLNPSASLVDRVTIVNPTPYQISLRVSRAGWDTGTALGTVAHGATKTFDDVLDQGEHWIFRFSASDLDGGELSVTREDLSRGHWNLTIPGAVAERLAAAGASPSARE